MTTTKHYVRSSFSYHDRTEVTAGRIPKLEMFRFFMIKGVAAQTTEEAVKPNNKVRLAACSDIASRSSDSVSFVGSL